ncbi:MAG: hypothetical protein AAB802_05085 [Patescibacteria group bacterium]
MAIDKKDLDSTEESGGLELAHSPEIKNLSTLTITLQDPRTRKKVQLVLGWHREIEVDRSAIRPKGSQFYIVELVKP